MNYKGKKVGLLLGGMSAEREVSFSTGRAVAAALKEKGFDVVEIDPDKNLAQKLLEKKVEVVYIALHGKYGEDGTVQGLCEIMKIPYTGSGVLSSSMAMDKEVSNVMAEKGGLKVPRWEGIEKKEMEKLLKTGTAIDFPLVVKPASEGSSVGIAIVKKKEELETALSEAFRYDNRILVQEYVKGREITVALLDGKPLGSVEITPKREFYDYTAKYTKGMTSYKSPAPISEKEEKKVFQDAEKAFEILHCKGVARADFILSEKGDFYFLEVNTLPGLTKTSLVPKVAAAAGIPFPDLVERILSGAALNIGS